MDNSFLTSKIPYNPMTYRDDFDYHSIDVFKPDGYYFITSNVSFAIARKPIWIHRAFTRLLLGWKWKDNV